MVEQEGHGEREDISKQPACQVPSVARPLHGVASRQLRKDGDYPVARSAEEGTPLGIRVELLGGVWGQKLRNIGRNPRVDLHLLNSNARGGDVTRVEGVAEMAWDARPRSKSRGTWTSIARACPPACTRAC